jgi:hypothetical protein
MLNLQNPGLFVSGDGNLDKPKTTQSWKVETLR